MRTLLLALSTALVLASACGSPCTRIRAAEENMNNKAHGCSNQSDQSLLDVQTCEKGLADCTQNDAQQLDAYAECLNNVAACVPGQEVSFSFARLGCLQPLGQVSGKCLSSTGAP